MPIFLISGRFLIEKKKNYNCPTLRCLKKLACERAVTPVMQGSLYSKIKARKKGIAQSFDFTAYGWAQKELVSLNLWCCTTSACLYQPSFPFFNQNSQKGSGRRWFTFSKCDPACCSITAVSKTSHSSDCHNPQEEPRREGGYEKYKVSNSWFVESVYPASYVFCSPWQHCK